MTKLIDCSEDVMNVLAGYLEPHHIGRLYMTGDALLIAKLRLIWLPSSTLSSIGRRTDLVTFMTGMYSRVVTNATAIRPSLSMATAFPKLRVLRLSCRDGRDGVDYTDMFNQSIDFTSLSSLSSLEIGRPYNIGAPIVLPPSVTSVDLASVCCLRPICGMDKLPYLRKVSFGLSSANRDIHRNFFDVVKWPASITSLDVDLYDDDASTFGKLPVTLERLVITGCATFRLLELSDVIDHLTRLTCLETDDCGVAVSRRLPSTLTSLQIRRLAISDGETFAHVAERIPPSVTDLNLGSLYFTDDRLTTPANVGAERGAEHLLPTLSLVSKERIFGLVIRYTNLNPSPSFAQRFRDVISIHGLDIHYVEEMINSKDTIDGDFRLERVARLMQLNCTDHEIRRMVCDRPVINHYFHRDWYSHGGLVYLNNCVRMLALGYTDTFNFSKAASHVDCPMDHPLPVSAARNVVELIICTETHERFDAFLVASETFESVRTVTVYFKGTHSVCLCLDILYKYRQKFPRLERVEFDSVYGRNDIRFGPKTLGQLHEMRLYVNPEENCLSYYVGRDSPSAVNVIK